MMKVEEDRLKLAKSIEIEDQDSNSVTIYDSRTGERCRITGSLYKVLRRLESFAPLSSAVEPDLLAAVKPAVDQLVRKGFLLKEHGEGAPPLPPLKPSEHTLFRVPSSDSAHMGADVAVLGIPFDGGNTILPGASKGPAKIREKSWHYQYRVDFGSGKPAGWFDVETGETLLENRIIRDFGDLRFTPGEPPEEIFERAFRVCGELTGSGAFPVLLGGDHSVSYPLIRALQSEAPLTVFWLDAHLDNAEWNPAICHHHGNVITRILQLPNVASVVHIGHRGYLNTGRPESCQVVSAGKLRRLGIERALESIRRGTNCYVSIDIDVLDPAYAPATSTPVPCGLTPLELKDLLREIGRGWRAIGLDLVELNPLRDAGEMTGMLASELLMVAMGSFTRSPVASRNGKVIEVEAGTELSVRER